MAPVPNSYIIVIDVKEELFIKAGKLGSFRFPSGIYIYAGSARKNINGRVLRHFKKDKIKHWHIDFLTSHRKTEIVKSVEFSCMTECKLIKRGLKLAGGIPLIKGFGSSDCKNGCPSHLLFFPGGFNEKIFK